ncbi:MAG TPA: alpha/beta hydrolase [Candidatus Dormibacteraeota bacterium]|nr:alpha/beta hydrolase [Candidatus Dormibacteraeota bacterium]
MKNYVLIPGADGRAWYWHRLTPLIQSAGHSVVAVELPVADPNAGLGEYAQAVVSAAGGRRDKVVLVAQSLAGFIAPLVARDVPVDQIVLLNAMVPRPGETAGEWWGNTGQEAARADYYRNHGLKLPAEFDPIEAFFHDVPPGVVEEATRMGEPVSRFDTLFTQPWPLEAWPRVPTRFIQGRDDRFLPLEFQRRVVAERLAIPVEELPGGHLVALSQPEKLAEILLSS